jgi:hypothetical protein
VPRGTREPAPESHSLFAYRAVTFYGGSFQILQLKEWFVTFRGSGNSLQAGPTTPHQQRSPAYTDTVWALPPSLAATEGISVDFYSWGY